MGCAPSAHKKRRPREDHHLIEASGCSEREMVCRTKRGSEAIIYSPVTNNESAGCAMWEWCLSATHCPLARSHSRHLDPLVQTDLKTNEFPTDSISEGEQLRLRTPPRLQHPVKVLLVFYKDDSTCRSLAAAADKLGYRKEVITKPELVVDVYQAHAVQPHIVFIDMRFPNFPGENICRTLRLEKKGLSSLVLVGILKRKSQEREHRKEIITALKMGFDRVLIEPLNATQCVSELIQLGWEEADRQVLQTQNSILTHTLDKSRELILLTDDTHHVQFVNKALCQLLGYKQEEMLNRNLPLFHQLGNMDQVISQLEKGADWNGKISWRSKNGEYITLHCRAMAFSEVGIEATHYIYMQENPHEPTICSRGSVPSVRKGSYDVKSINSEADAPELDKIFSGLASYGAQSSRRMSLARLHNLPLETPITKIITYINIVQENSSPQMNQMLDKGPTPSHALRRSSNDSVAASALKTTQISGKPSFTLFSSPVLKELLDSSLMWDFSIFKLEETTGGRPLVYLGMNILMHFDVHKTLSCDERTLYNWLTVIERNYRSSNSYHNSTHAADVLQATAAFLEREQLKKIMDNLDEACGLIAAVCHDIDHPGMSSAFLCNSGDELAILYNDLSVLESHHAAHTFKLTLADDRINIFKALDKDVYKAARQSIIDMILATEMTKHFEHLTKFVSVFIKPTVTMEEVAQLSGNEVKSPSDNPEFIEMSPDDAILVKRMMIKCADISNPTRNVKLCVEWARRIAEEYFNQTDEEKTRNLPIVMPMFDRQSCSIPKSQMGFIDYIINDMFEAWDVFIDMPELLYNVRNNYQYWKDMEERGCTSIDKISSPSNTTILPNIPEKNSNS
ncbi:high affinity cAMP-specific and IBMX-insensitive 3',5'-cyclic phosphodiesterase 8-like isoform X3 [Lycorma delicatula]|uniref:high affinity cAMP-specific and IBMX-insensitive 3',5'-cyclic phosphodiesterase 8-like isoform X3 n=1 Tax=Lycorma delicatula TaxID=130591 RepID=UPI003F510275